MIVYSSLVGVQLRKNKIYSIDCQEPSIGLELHGNYVNLPIWEGENAVT
jgi:hypothetical protein